MLMKYVLAFTKPVSAAVSCAFALSGWSRDDCINGYHVLTLAHQSYQTSDRLRLQELFREAFSFAQSW